MECFGRYAYECVYYRKALRRYWQLTLVSLQVLSTIMGGVQINLPGSTRLPCFSFLHKSPSLFFPLSSEVRLSQTGCLLSWAAEMENSYYYSVVEWVGSFCLYLSISEYPLRPYLLPPKGSLTCFSKEIKIFYLMTPQCKSSTEGSI